MEPTIRFVVFSKMTFDFYDGGDRMHICSDSDRCMSSNRRHVLFQI